MRPSWLHRSSSVELETSRAQSIWINESSSRRVTRTGEQVMKLTRHAHLQGLSLDSIKSFACLLWDCRRRNVRRPQTTADEIVCELCDLCIWIRVRWYASVGSAHHPSGLKGDAPACKAASNVSVNLRECFSASLRRLAFDAIHMDSIFGKRALSISGFFLHSF